MSNDRFYTDAINSADLFFFSPGASDMFLLSRKRRLNKMATQGNAAAVPTDSPNAVMRTRARGGSEGHGPETCAGRAFLAGYLPGSRATDRYFKAAFRHTSRCCRSERVGMRALGLSASTQNQG